MSETKKSVITWDTVGVIVTMLGCAVAITLSVGGLSTRITEQGGDFKLLKAEVGHMGETIGAKLDVMGKRVDRVEVAGDAHSLLCLDKEHLKSIMIQLQALNKDFKIPHDL